MNITYSFNCAKIIRVASLDLTRQLDPVDHVVTEVALQWLSIPQIVKDHPSVVAAFIVVLNIVDVWKVKNRKIRLIGYK